MGDGTHVQQAIDAALGAREKWANTPWQDRAAIFLKCAELRLYSRYDNNQTLPTRAKGTERITIMVLGIDSKFM